MYYCLPILLDISVLWLRLSLLELTLSILLFLHLLAADGLFLIGVLGHGHRVAELVEENLNAP